MRNIKLTLAYDGSAYAGFQRQARQATIQSTLEDRLRRLTGEPLHVTAAGRTDAGVHALGQVVNFRTASRIPAPRFAPALNSVLPRDIAVLEAALVPDDFHARFSAKSKTYTYRIWCPAVRPVFERDRAYHFPRALDLPAMAAAAGALVGRHDFACFQSAGSSVRTSTRTVYHAVWEPRGNILAFTVRADGFLYRMVRNMVGTLLQVGLGKHSPEWIGALLAAGRRTEAGPAVPACGLYLVEVEY